MNVSLQTECAESRHAKIGTKNRGIIPDPRRFPPPRSLVSDPCQSWGCPVVVARPMTRSGRGHYAPSGNLLLRLSFLDSRGNYDSNSIMGKVVAFCATDVGMPGVGQAPRNGHVATEGEVARPLGVLTQSLVASRTSQARGGCSHSAFSLA